MVAIERACLFVPQLMDFPVPFGDSARHLDFSVETMDGRVAIEDVVKWYVESPNMEFGTDFESPFENMGLACLLNLSSTLPCKKSGFET